MVNVKPRKRGRAAVHAVPDRVEEHAAPPPSPGSLVELPLDAVRRYRQRYNLPIAPPATYEGFLLGGPVGKLSSAHARHRRSSYRAAHQAVLDHLADGVVKEGDAIAEFLYTVQHKDQVFKLRFGRDDSAAAAPAGTASANYVPAHAPNAPAPAPAPAPASVPTPTDALAPQAQQPAPESQIPLPVEPLSARPNRTTTAAEYTPDYAAVTVHG